MFHTDAEKAEVFADSLQRQCQPNESTAEHSEFHREVIQAVSNIDLRLPQPTPRFATPDEIETLIRALKSRKAPGIDGISNSVLKLLPKKHRVYICCIVNGMLRLGYFPDAWKDAVVVCIPKQGKPHTLPDSFRPISLLSALSKLAEGVVLARLQEHIDANNIIQADQCGFRKEHGTLHQLLRVSEYIAENLNRRRHTAMLLLDVRQAFDRVWHDGLVYKLRSFEFPLYLIACVESFLRNRRLRVRVGKDLSTSRSIGAGVPQGSKLSPVLFNVYCADIPTRARVEIALYADDIALISSSRHLSTCAQPIQEHLPTLLDWYSQWGLRINESKSEAIMFSRRRSHRTPPLCVNRKHIPWSPCVKYLGVYLDRRLSWIRHINYARQKARAIFAQLRPMFNCPRLSCNTKLRIFTAFVRSVMCYGIPIWGSALPRRLASLQGTFMRLLRRSVGFHWCVRNAQVLYETGLPDLFGFATRLAENLHSTLQHHPNPTIARLADLRPKTYDTLRRPCCLVTPT